MTVVSGQVAGGDFPHLLFYGPSGSGKKTRVQCLLKEIFGGTVDKMRMQEEVVLTASKKKVVVRTITSNCHMVVSPADAGRCCR